MRNPFKPKVGSWRWAKKYMKSGKGAVRCTLPRDEHKAITSQTIGYDRGWGEFVEVKFYGGTDYTNYDYYRIFEWELTKGYKKNMTWEPLLSSPYRPIITRGYRGTKTY